jgi:hypothetical protein
MLPVGRWQRAAGRGGVVPALVSAAFSFALAARLSALGVRFIDLRRPHRGT